MVRVSNHIFVKLMVNNHILVDIVEVKGMIGVLPGEILELVDSYKKSAEVIVLRVTIKDC